MKEENSHIYPNFPKELKIKSQLHLDRYIKFIDSRPIRNKTKNETEHHHKTPKSLGGSDLDVNKVHLTFREHLFAHLILYKAFGGKMTFAYWRMLNTKKGMVISLKQYAKMKKETLTLLAEER